MKLLENLLNRKKKKLRELNLSNETWVRIGEIYSRILVNRKVSITNEQIIEWAIEVIHDSVVKRGSLDK